MSNMAHVFISERFNLLTLTTAINLIAEKPKDLGIWFNWNSQGVNTFSVAVEEKHGKLSVLATAPRGTIGQGQSSPKRVLRTFEVPHYPQYDKILATEIQNVRAFGSDNDLEVLDQKIAERIAEMRDNHDVTDEFLRACAVSGVLRDKDGSLIYDWHDEMKVERNVHDIDFDDASIDIRDELIKAKRKGEIAIGGSLMYSGWKLVCTPYIFSAITTHPSVKAAFDRWQDGAFLRADNRQGFMIATDIEVVSYHNSKVGDLEFIEDGESYLVPNSPTLFQTRFAPADTMETANTIGLPLYLMSEPMPFGRGVSLASETNALVYPTLPRAIVQIKQR